MSVNCLTSKDSLFNNLNAIFFTCLEVSHIVYFDVLKKLNIVQKWKFLSQIRTFLEFSGTPFMLFGSLAFHLFFSYLSII